ncbi:hypothetical protein QCA50_005574 [Cerrena zonata]|uniref:Uncharacterized protein n=1 Tax=Cerrena zonata TaxID=2478898 RepID=A0AAW0GC37_9APHY
MRARKSFLWHAKFLQEHEDVQKSVIRLVVRKDWSRRSFRYSSVYDNEDNVRKFYTPLYKAVCHTIPYLGSLRYLILSGWKLTSILLGQLQFLPQLHTLEMDQCKLIAPLSHPLPQLPSVLNLSYTFHEDAHFASWIVMHICPNLETLSVSITNELHNSDPDLPVENFVDEFNPFMTLRKYYISSISVSAVPRLTSWIRTARGQSPDRKIPLTHFKIDVNGGIKKDVILDLLDALKGSSVESLILDGIRYAELDLLDKIAQALPNLLDLVLIYRDSDRQLRPEFIEWPHASWEYASHFSSFKRLQYIGWNCRRFSPTFTPVSMLRFEDDDFTDSTLDDRESDRDYPPDEERLLAKCLWSYCPTLEYMLITSEYPASLYRRNDKDGLVQFESVIDQGAFRRNPNMGWPPCNPRKQD